MKLSQETDEKRLMLLRAAAEHMSKKFTMKVQEVKPQAQTDWLFHVRAAHNVHKVDVCACSLP